MTCARSKTDPYALTSAMGDFDYTSRDTIDIQNDVKIAGGCAQPALTFGAIVYNEQYQFA
jgi:hypothetical protein